MGPLHVWHTLTTLREELLVTAGIILLTFLGMCASWVFNSYGQVMATPAVQDFIATIYNEVMNNSEWEFNGSRMAECSYRLAEGYMDIVLKSGVRLRISVTEIGISLILCPGCQQAKPGWPESWGNVSEGKGLMYACADCVTKRKESNEPKPG